MINKILFIRRDNIGDLICTTPAIHAVRQAYPEAKIGILVNTYNAEAIMNNPDIDEIYIYEKAKHFPEKSKLSVWLNNVKVLMKIRKEKYDIAVACGSYSPRLARFIYMTGAKLRIGYLPENIEKSFFYNLPIKEIQKPMHEVERVFDLLAPLEIKGVPDKMKIFPSQEKIQWMKEFLESKRFLASDQNHKIRQNNLLIAFHISSRKPENRWSAEKFINLARLIQKNHNNIDIMLLWSPGSEKNPYHPGDDEKAEYIIKAVPEIIAVKTLQLSELIAALSLVNLVVCLDGGAMHIAAALGKPLVTLWGSTDPIRWKPWGVDHILIQSNGKKAENIDVELVYHAVNQLLSEIV